MRYLKTFNRLYIMNIFSIIQLQAIINHANFKSRIIKTLLIVLND